MKKIIAIDGPAGAGKSTIAKKLAAKLQYLYIDTGAMYRAIAYLAIKNHIAFDDADKLTALAANSVINMKAENGSYTIYIDDIDVTSDIRTPEVGAAASPVSAVSGVRKHLVAQQQRLAAGNCVVMDGRDIGTKVLPNADCKIYLTASLEERAQRRCLELQNKGIKATVEQVKTEIAERDHRDMNRADSPLMQAADSVLLDTTNMNIDQVMTAIEKLCQG